jgi:sugar lactone lactonase YvrE
MYALAVVGCSKKVDAPKSDYGQVTTLAGSGTSGSSDGKGTAASFSNIWGITVDASDNVYVTDGGLNQVRKITPDGVVTTLPDNGPGSTDINGVPHIYDDPLGLAVDKNGTLYISYIKSAVIRKIAINSKGIVIAKYGDQDGLGTSVGLGQPIGLALDNSDNLYVAGYSSMSIIKVAPNGMAGIIAGTRGISGATNGAGTVAKFNTPSGVAVDAENNIYVADSGNNLIRKIMPDGTVSTFAGSGVTGSNDGQGTSASFNYPIAVAVDGNGNVYVSDSNNNIIRKISPTGNVTTIAGNTSVGSANGIGTAATLSIPAGLAVNHEGTLLYVADRGNNLVRKIAIK